MAALTFKFDYDGAPPVAARSDNFQPASAATFVLATEAVDTSHVGLLATATWADYVGFPAIKLARKKGQDLVAGSYDASLAHLASIVLSRPFNEAQRRSESPRLAG